MQCVVLMGSEEKIEEDKGRDDGEMVKFYLKRSLILKESRMCGDLRGVSNMFLTRKI